MCVGRISNFDILLHANSLRKILLQFVSDVFGLLYILIIKKKDCGIIKGYWYTKILYIKNKLHILKTNGC